MFKSANPGLRLSRKALMLAAVAAIPQAVLAEDVTAEEAAPAEGEEIVVDGTRPIAESEAAALRTQRQSDNLVSVLSADSVGRLPDQNIAQATGRLPGLAVERDQGQARYISIRGAPRSGSSRPEWACTARSRSWPAGHPQRRGRRCRAPRPRCRHRC